MAEPLVTGEPARHRRLELLDVLRFGAALMVVCFHWLFNGISNGKVDSVPFTPFAPVAIYGVYGVHLFFLISGFVIAESARGKSAGQFVVSRGVRLFPAYWVAMLVTTVVVNVWGTAELHVSGGQFLANLTMMPALFRQLAVDGVYWTLTIELTFYLLVLVVLLLGLVDSSILCSRCGPCSCFWFCCSPPALPDFPTLVATTRSSPLARSSQRSGGVDSALSVCWAWVRR